MPFLKCVTLGCKVNQYETEFVRQGLIRLGYRDVQNGEAADLCIVNTCTVTADGDAKSRKAIRHLHKLYPHAEIIVMGCYATRAPEELAALPGVFEVIADKRQLPELLARRGLVDVPTGISAFGTRHRAYVKVQDGCQMHCAYCVIPLVRPVPQSRPVDDVLAEVCRLTENGHREIVLTGIHLGHYGVEFADASIDLARLVRRTIELPGEFRVRISSIEAAEVTPELLSVMAERADRVCPHLHISMQSGSDAVLRRMNRRCPVEQFLRCCQQVRQVLDNPAITTDVIVGFPGETEADFAATRRVVEKVGFSKLHVFRFCPRPGTPAAEMPDRVPSVVQQRRSEELAEIGRRLRQRYFESLLGRQLQVLVESPSTTTPGHIVGTSGQYAPVEFLGSQDRIGQLIHVVANKVVMDCIQAG
jgi:threonylcarbamoyladenosine tRNA methylthiotransferase MtaB